jgi:hypothetical protein
MGGAGAKSAIRGGLRAIICIQFVLGLGALFSCSPSAAQDGHVDIWGTLDASGVVINASALASSEPALMTAVLDCDQTFDIADLTADAQEVYASYTGSAAESAALAMEVAAGACLAQLLQTNDEILYSDLGGKKADFRVLIDDRPVGVTVTRAVGYPYEDPYTQDMASTLLSNKLGDILLANANVDSSYAWDKQILVVFAYAEGHVDSLTAAWNALDAGTKGDTIVLAIRTDGDDAFLY